MRVSLALVAGLCAWVSTATAQLIFNAQSGGNQLFQQSAGTVSQITAGLSDYGFPSISRDGRLVVVSGPDPAQPAQPSTDLWLIDRVAQTTTRIVNHTSTNLPSDGTLVTVNPSHSELRPDNLVVAVTDQLLFNPVSGGGDVIAQLNIYRVSDGFYLDLVEMGNGDALDLTRSEFVGISWLPDGSGFATPAYDTFTAQSGAPRDLVGIQFYSYNQALGTAARAGALSVPLYYDQVSGLPSTTHIFPAFSPDGTRLAYFEINWPNALLTAQATARLVVANANGSSAYYLATFTTGQFPQGLTWSADGSRLIFSLADQVNAGGIWISAGDSTTADIWSIDSVSGGPLSQLPGVTSGYLPNYPAINLLGQTDITIEPFSPTMVLIRATGLPGSALFGIQSTTDMESYGPRQNFTGAQFSTGVTVTPPEEFRAFRLLE